ncbi:MAG: prepilin-type N-terminal cleavage/methylation domain-containing protein [Desulfobacteraceae bacterium]|nr:prepilin-type N-terminal cleavage/methylation domain-containing protein [Desulfobacteraceae bacterium]
MNNNNGFTLIELLIAMAISTYVIGAIFMTYQSQQTSYTDQEQVVVTQQILRSTSSIMAMELRMAGFDPSDTWNAGFSQISVPNALIFTKEDETNPNNLETITYALNAGTNTLTRTDNGSGAQAFADNIEAIGFAYAFDSDGDGYIDTYNAGGTETVIWAVDSDGDNDLDLNLDTDGNGVIDAADGPGDGGNGIIPGQALTDFSGAAIPDMPVDNIRAVRAWILARTSRPRRNFTNWGTYTVGNLVITPDTDGNGANDNFPMRLSDSIVKCKNMGL